MSKYFLDTNICVHILRRKEPWLTKIRDIGLKNCEISVITYAELTYGAYCSQDSEKSILAVDTLCGNLILHSIDEFVKDFAIEKARLKKEGLVIEDNDIYIGVTARECGLPLLTENCKHLTRIEGLTIAAI